jgi:putative ABC transport system ATP-binding protein
MNNQPHSIIIRGRGLKRYYKRGIETVKALDGVDIDIHTGEMVAILGPSGSGKTTLVNLLSCLDAPTEGELSLDGHDVAGVAEDQLAKVRRGVLGFIFQKFHLIPTLTVAENVELPLLFLNRPAVRSATLSVLTSVGLASRADHLPKELSGGEMQRVAVARALITHPKVMIADEPTGNLDKATGEAIFALLRNLVTEQGLTVIITTHNLALAYQADRIITIEDGKLVREEIGVSNQKVSPLGAANVP